MGYEHYEPQELVPASAPSDGSVLSGDEDLDREFGDTTDRHDGWTGERMAMFCALLAETGIVTDACHAVGKSTTSAYSARRRNPLFGAAWEEALGLARGRLADALLERSLNGSVEKYYRDGELVGEKRILDNRLGMQVLRRLDARAETSGLATTPVRTERSRGALAQAPAQSPDWDLMLAALRTGDAAMIAEALAEAKRAETGEVGEVCVAGNRHDSSVDLAENDEEPQRCWWDEDDECWLTDFPPPPGFGGYQKGRWGDEDYRRDCTPEETTALNATFDAELAEERAEDEALRDQWFVSLSPPS